MVLLVLYCVIYLISATEVLNTSIEIGSTNQLTVCVNLVRHIVQAILCTLFLC